MVDQIDRHRGGARRARAVPALRAALLRRSRRPAGSAAPSATPPSSSSSARCCAASTATRGTVGKRPAATARARARRASRQIQRLHDELQRAVEREEFERAAGLRDEIRELEQDAGRPRPARRRSRERARAGACGLRRRWSARPARWLDGRGPARGPRALDAGPAGAQPAQRAVHAPRARGAARRACSERVARRRSAARASPAACCCAWTSCRRSSARCWSSGTSCQPRAGRRRPAARASWWRPSERLSLMINEEDHLRLQALASGFQLAEAWAAADAADDELDQSLDFAFSDEIGYLTACPTNVGHRAARLGAHPPAGAGAARARSSGCSRASRRWGSTCAASTASTATSWATCSRSRTRPRSAAASATRSRASSASPARSSRPRSGRASG